ncbi:ACP phosphodiesterase [Thioclava sp. SK-1]|uniref:NADPH-dependent FMN reductase n=1 Tax=Thioclava sp. SK-1 TaxID=1889770 RepID=UPI0008271661|nr:NAD(P)H-dependent oxidoreductase [Thioclava sp. SK-1]OCX62077.1 ACP phosphodiesterase [Thioclava sp. SK-1]
MTHKVAVLVGSLRKGSFNRMIANTLVEVAPKTLEFDFIEIGDLPLYNPDLDEDDTRPAAWSRFRTDMAAHDAVLFVTPEYNRTLPASIKNALDVGSRPYGASIWDKKPSAIVTGSMGGVGGFGANHNLRQALVFLNAAPMQQPEAYIPAIHELFNDDGTIKKDDTKKFFASIMEQFGIWIDKLA